MERLRAKSLLLTGYLEYLIRSELSEKVEIITPSNPAARGCHLSVSFNVVNTATGEKLTAEDVLETLKNEGIFGDVRKPNVIRITPTPLYNSFLDVFEFITILKKLFN
jgi:kynureninase